MIESGVDEAEQDVEEQMKGRKEDMSWVWLPLLIGRIPGKARCGKLNITGQSSPV